MIGFESLEVFGQQEGPRKIQEVTSGSECSAGAVVSEPKAIKYMHHWTKSGSQNLEPKWFPKRGDNEMEQTVGFHFVVPHFGAPNWYPKNGTKF